MARQNAAVTSRQAGGTEYIAAFRYEMVLFVNDTTSTGYGGDVIREGTTGEGVQVGIRLVGVAFSTHYLSLPETTRKALARSISVLNPNVESTFHDVVINSDDDKILLDPDATAHLYCTDGCPTVDYAMQTNYYLIGIGGGVVLFLILIIVGPGGAYLCFVQDRKPMWNRRSAADDQKARRDQLYNFVSGASAVKETKKNS